MVMGNAGIRLLEVEVAMGNAGIRLLEVEVAMGSLLSFTKAANRHSISRAANPCALLVLTYAQED